MIVFGILIPLRTFFPFLAHTDLFCSHYSMVFFGSWFQENTCGKTIIPLWSLTYINSILGIITLLILLLHLLGPSFELEIWNTNQEFTEKKALIYSFKFYAGSFWQLYPVYIWVEPD